MTLVYSCRHKVTFKISLCNYMGILQVYYFDPVENIYVVVFKGEKGEILAFSHCRGRKFETCIAHQKIPNEIKHLEETLGAFSLVQSSMVRVDYFS